VPLASDLDLDDFARQAEGFTGADLESLCKKATLNAIAELQNGIRVKPFVVLRNDFLTVLESGRKDLNQLEKANED